MKNMKKSFLGVFFILLLFLLSVSSNASGKLNRSNATLMVRSTLQLKLTGVSGTVKWSSSNNKIAKVDKNGKVTAVADGTAEIQAKHAGQTYRCKIKVIHETYKTVALDFHDFNSWAQEISQKERGLVNTGLGLAPQSGYVREPVLAWQHDYRKEDPGEQDRLAEDSSPWSRECGIPDGEDQPSL